ncbi:aminotransferase class I/II-fold pyridoxal phosphate-dependent enzyme [Paenibacillus thalictri]|uniref:Aminotransferase class I/II-fold pyridoxal phosphate-dependent enzyme n=1 Tax=Paenibacillus thalictri TaxID=2527873 RepID=A0A4Q9DHB9_9BACL|nr:aminotransferase class I/II-fold pyridoxal phosphate-dependent enzyme [Paenibacillus thalictri]TBL70835.1 aminotransferase class I/II-fold pyridoxal phosphate-dependent enzyme [Paenibacillus thalictri]
MTSTNNRIYLSPPHMGKHEWGFIEEAFETNWISSVGPNVNLFEQEMAEYVGAEGAVALCSCTAAIHLSLRLLNVGPGDLVFCSSLTFIASANPILYEGAEPVFIDSEPASWNMSPIALERALQDALRNGKRPKAVIVVNIYGQSADMRPILELCSRYDVPVIEDAAESLGATYNGKASGTFGKFGAYSFSGNKIITTSGGGMLISNDLEALERARFLATQARDPAKYYQHSQLGYNYRLSNVLAGIGRGQLQVLEERVQARRHVFATYYKHLSSIPGLEFMPEMSYGRSNRWLTSLTIDPAKAGFTACQVVEALEERNVESRPVWKPLHMQPLYERYPYYPHKENEHVAERLFRTGICLPSGSNLTDNEMFRIIDCITSMVKITSSRK